MTNMNAIDLESIEQHDLRHILTCFREMGASDADLILEKQKLLEDSQYCQEWLRVIGF